MANVFTNAKAALVGTAGTDVYTTPAGTTAVIHGLFISNLLATAIKITVKSGTYNILKDVEILPESTLVVNKPINLQAAEVLTVVSNTDVSADVFVSVLEVS